MLFQPSKTRKALVVIGDGIEPAVNIAPGAGPLVDHGKISAPDELIKRPVGFGKQIAQLNLDLAARDTPQPITYATRGAVVTLAEASGQDKDFFHDSLS